MPTLAGTLASVAARLPRALVSRGALARVGAVASRFPAALSNLLYLECRLAAGDAQVDVALLVDRRGRDALAGGAGARGVALPGRAAGVHALARRWADRGDPLHAALEGVWLELDVPAAARPGPLPVPSAFADFADALAGTPRFRRALLADAALATLRGERPPTAHARAVRRCIAGLPHGAHLLYAGAMLSRSPSVTRLCVMLPDGGVRPYLDAVAWPGPAGALADLAAALGRAGAAPSIVHLDVHDGGIGAAVGLELPLARPDQMRGSIREVALLDRLVALGLCAPAKRDALHRWPGYAIGTMPHELWPSVVVRRVNHVKVTLSAGGAVQAKAYLCVHHERRPAQRARGCGARTGASSE